MSALGHKQTFAPQKAMSASPPKADICRRKLPIVKHDHRLPDVERRALWDYWSPQAGLAESWRSRQGRTSRTAALASAENLLRLPSGRQRFFDSFLDAAVLQSVAVSSSLSKLSSSFKVIN
jgi:hypothetical protein